MRTKQPVKDVVPKDLSSKLIIRFNISFIQVFCFDDVSVGIICVLYGILQLIKFLSHTKEEIIKFKLDNTT